ncbi:MAG: hypothetical protein AB1489_25795 [Acidobacteriota bacterium]
MPEDNLSSVPHCHCFRCKSGCFHIVWGNTMLSFTFEQFVTFADSVNGMYRQLQQENEPTVEIISGHSDSLLM